MTPPLRDGNRRHSTSTSSRQPTPRRRFIETAATDADAVAERHARLNDIDTSIISRVGHCYRRQPPSRTRSPSDIVFTEHDAVTPPIEPPYDASTQTARHKRRYTNNTTENAQHFRRQIREDAATPTESTYEDFTPSLLK